MSFFTIIWDENSNALQAVIDKASKQVTEKSISGISIHVAPGTYSHEETLWVRPGVHLIGMKDVIFKFGAMNDFVSAVYVSQGASITDLTIIAARCDAVVYLMDGRAEGCTIRFAGNIGMKAEGDSINVSGCTFVNESAKKITGRKQHQYSVVSLKIYFESYSLVNRQGQVTNNHFSVMTPEKYMTASAISMLAIEYTPLNMFSGNVFHESCSLAINGRGHPLFTADEFALLNDVRCKPHVITAD